MPKEKNNSSKKRATCTDDERTISTLPKRTRTYLQDEDIEKTLVNESDDNCSDFDDDVEDPDYELQSTHSSDSEQSDNENEDHQVIRYLQHFRL